jgi:hypothetical protein
MIDSSYSGHPPSKGSTIVSGYLSGDTGPQLFTHWPEQLIGIQYKNALHKKLPNTLSNLLHQQAESEGIINSNIFSKETPYRPRWVAVINKEENFG